MVIILLIRYKILINLLNFFCCVILHDFKVGDHKEMIKTLSNSGHLIHEYDMGSQFRGYAAKMTERYK